MFTLSANESKAGGSLRRGIFHAVVATSAILMVPLVAMRFGNGVYWTRFDFLIAGILLMVTNFALISISRIVRTARLRMAAYSATLFALLYISAELAVGVFGNLGR